MSRVSFNVNKLWPFFPLAVKGLFFYRNLWVVNLHIISSLLFIFGGGPFVMLTCSRVDELVVLIRIMKVRRVSRLLSDVCWVFCRVTVWIYLLLESQTVFELCFWIMWLCKLGKYSFNGLLTCKSITILRKKVLVIESKW